MIYENKSLPSLKHPVIPEASLMQGKSFANYSALFIEGMYTNVRYTGWIYNFRQGANYVGISHDGVQRNVVFDYLTSSKFKLWEANGTTSLIIYGVK